MIARDGKIITRWKLPALTLALQDRPARNLAASCCSATTGRFRFGTMSLTSTRQVLSGAGRLRHCDRRGARGWHVGPQPQPLTTCPIRGRSLPADAGRASRAGTAARLDWAGRACSIVLAGYVVFVIAGLMVIFSGLIRENSTLIVFGPASAAGRWSGHWCCCSPSEWPHSWRRHSTGPGGSRCSACCSRSW